MDFEKYEKYMDARAAVRKENERRIGENFSECEKYVADNFVCCGCVFTKHDENLKKQGFMIWQDNGTISHKWLTLKECGIAPLELLPYPEYK